MSESTNITIAVGKSKGKMLPLVQDYDDYVAEYNMEQSNSDFFTMILNKYNSNVYSFLKPNVAFQNSESLTKIAKAFDKDPNITAVVCDGFRKKDGINIAYYLDTNRLSNINLNVPIFFHKNIVNSITWGEDPYEKLIELFNACLSQEKLIIHIAEPLIVINE